MAKCVKCGERVPETKVLDPKKPVCMNRGDCERRVLDRQRKLMERRGFRL